MKKLLCILLILALACPALCLAQEDVTLRIYAFWSDQIGEAFTQKYPHIRIESVEGEGVQTSLVSGEDVDIYPTYTQSTYKDILNKGYAQPLTHETLVNLTKTMHPAIQSVLYQNEQLMAVPFQIILDTWSVNVTAYEKMGFSEAAIPATLQELVDQMILWQDGLSEEYTDNFFIEGSSLRYMLSTLTRQYILSNETDTAALNFDTPAYRALLQILEDNRAVFYDASAEEEAIQNSGVYKVPLFFNYQLYLGYGHIDSDLTRMMMIPAIDDNTPRMTTGEMGVYFINPNSKHKEEAELFLTFLLENMEPSNLYYYYPDINEPLISPYYESNLANVTQSISEAEAKLAAAVPDQKQALQDELDTLNARLARIKADPYTISPASIAVYREVSENLILPMESIYLAGGSNCYEALQTLLYRFADGELNIDRLIDDLNRTCQQAFKER